MTYYDNRLMCSVLEEMRECFRTYNFSPILSLIEEAQIMANRMEAGLQDKSYIKNTHKRIKKLEKLRNNLKTEIEELEEKAENLTGEKKIKEEDSKTMSMEEWEDHLL